MRIKYYGRIGGDGMGGDYAHIVKIGDGFPQVITPSEPKFHDDVCTIVLPKTLRIMMK